MSDLFKVVAPIIIGFGLDCLAGDPHSMPHPIRLIGNLIAWLDKKLLPEPEAGNRRLARQRGIVLAVIVLVASTGIPAGLLWLAYRYCSPAGVVLEGIFCYYLLAARSLRDESMKVYHALPSLADARYALSMIVGRDTERLDQDGVVKATVETVAENTSDGVTAPLFYMAFGGAVAGFFYKAANTMDSMIGYQNDRYQYYGTFAAKLDDILNYIPSRLTALLMIIASGICGMDMKGAYRIWKRDRRKHKSPNSAQTEAVCAGALQVELAGDAYYFGKLHRKDTIGDPIRSIELQDIKKANRLMYVTVVMMFLITVAIRAVFYMWIAD